MTCCFVVFSFFLFCCFCMRNSPVPVNLYSNSTVGLRCCCSDDVKMHGFSVIIDMRGSTWHSVKPFLRVLQVCGIFSITQHPPFYGHYARQPALTGTPVKNWRILLVQSFTARMPLLAATGAFGLGRRRWSSQQCYLHCLRTFLYDVNVIFRVLIAIIKH